MCFGAAASVWNFNRAADALQLLLRGLLLVVGRHYVDDFNAIDYRSSPRPPSRPSPSSCTSWVYEPRSPRRRRPPLRTCYGVSFHVTENKASLEATARCIVRVKDDISRALATDSLSPEDAGRVAGRLSFWGGGEGCIGTCLLTIPRHGGSRPPTAQ